MPNALFDGLASIFVDTLGEPVTYMPASTGLPVAIQAIWTERSLDVVLGENAGGDAISVTLKVRAADVVPAEGDVATRVSDGKVMQVTTPISPDGKGMIICNLAARACGD